MTQKTKNLEFIEKAMLKHNNLYDYSLVEYVNAKTKVKINCPIHGEFEQEPSNHLTGNGCPKCKGQKISLKKTKNIDSFIFDSNVIHNYFYNYNKISYVNWNSKVTIICPIHGEFEQTPNNHLTGHGCKKCANIKTSKAAIDNSYGWSYSRWSDKIKNNPEAKPILYIIKCYNDIESFIKVGISMRTLKKRYPSYKSMPYKFDIINVLELSSETTFRLEKIIKRELKFEKYKPLTKFNGSCESFKIESLDMINLIINNYLQ